MDDIHGSVGTIYQGSVNKSQNQRITTNHIYLHPGERSGEFERWMREIGGLLQLDREYSTLKPLLDLIVAVLEPNRIFLIPHPAIEKYQVKPYVEIILILDGWAYDLDRNEPIVKGILELVCMKQRTVVFNIHSGDEWEAEMKDGYFYNVAHCRSKFLVFSGSPYRLEEPEADSLKNFQNNFSSKFNNQVEITEHFFKKCKALLCEGDVVSDLVFTLFLSCLKQIYRMVIWALSFDIPSLNRSCKELEEMATRVLPQLRGQLSKNTDVYLSFGSDYLEAHDGEIVGMEHYVSYLTELERLFEIAKIAFEQKMVVLFDPEEKV